MKPIGSQRHQNPGNERNHTPVQTRFFHELRELEKIEQLNPPDNINSQTQFLSIFDWTDSTLEPKARQAVETELVQFHDNFARHRFDIGINTKVKVQLTRLDNKPACPLIAKVIQHRRHPRGDCANTQVLHYQNITFSKIASSVLAQKKHNGKLCPLFNLRKLNTLKMDGYITNNHRVSTLNDAPQHMAGKKLFCQLDCSQAYHCLQMADQQSLELFALFAFSFASRTFA